MATLTILGRFFVDDVGEPSCLRLVTFLVPLLILGNWIGCCIMQGQYVPLGMAEASLISACLFAKAAQSKFENTPAHMSTAAGAVANGAQPPTPFASATVPGRQPSNGGPTDV